MPLVRRSFGRRHLGSEAWLPRTQEGTLPPSSVRSMIPMHPVDLLHETDVGFVILDDNANGLAISATGLSRKVISENSTPRVLSISFAERPRWTSAVLLFLWSGLAHSSCRKRTMTGNSEIVYLPAAEGERRRALCFSSHAAWLVASRNCGAPSVRSHGPNLPRTAELNRPRIPRTIARPRF